jgi:hypothetical protein
MSTSINLKELERQAFLRTYEDGLWEIYFGGMLASFAAFGFTVFPGNFETPLAFVIYLVGIGLSGLIFWLGKKFITMPRIGLVKFGPRRQKRMRDLAIALLIIVALQTVAILVQFGFLPSPDLQLRFAPVLGSLHTESLGVAILAVLFVSPGMLLVAYFTDIPGGYYHAVIMALAVFLMILLDQAWWMVIGGVLILVPGVVHLMTFLHRYPLEDGSHESA